MLAALSVARQLTNRLTRHSASRKALAVVLTTGVVLVELAVVANLGIAAAILAAYLGVEAAFGRSLSAVIRLTGMDWPDITHMALVLSAAVGMSLLWAVLRATEGAVRGRLAVLGADRYRQSIVRQLARVPAFSQSADREDLLAASGGKDLGLVRRCIAYWFELTLREPIVVAVCLLVAFAIAPLVTVFLTLCGVLAVVAAAQAVRPIRGAARKLAALRHECEKLGQAILRHLDIARANGYEEHELNRVNQIQKRCYSLERSETTFQAWLWPLAILFWIVCLIAMVALLAWAIVQRRIGVGESVFLIGAIGLAGVAAHRMWTIAAELAVSSRRLAQLLSYLDIEETVRQLPDARFLPPLERELRFDRVTVVRKGQPLLQNVSFVVPRDAKVALLTTDRTSAVAVAYLVPRLYDPDEGRVLVDGVDIREATLESLRAHVGVVLQDSYTFLDTVRNNITGADPSIPLTRVVEAAKVAHAHQFIQRLKDGYDTVIGPEGVQLTTGEQFRIALARLVLKDPAIAIIEEPDTPLDDDTRQLVDDTLSRFCPGRAVLILARRLSTLKTADRIVLLNKGAVEDQGTHPELTQRSELYRHLQYTLAQRRKHVLAAVSARPLEESTPTLLGRAD